MPSVNRLEGQLGLDVFVLSKCYNRITAAYEADDDAVAAADDMCDLQDRIEAAIGGVELLIP